MPLFKRILSLVARIGISALLLLFLFRDIHISSIFQLIRSADRFFLWCGFLVFSLNYVLCFFRWEMLLKASHLKLAPSRALISFAGGVFFNLFLPSTIGGDLVRSVDLSVHTRRPREVVATVLLDRLSGYVGLVLVAVFALLGGWRFVRDGTVAMFVGIITAILAFLLFLLFNAFLYRKVNQFLRPSRTNSALNRFRDFLSNLHEEVHIFKAHRKVIAYNLCMSVAIQLVAPLSFYLIARSLGINTGIIYFFVFLPIIGAVTLLPVSIGGLGLREASTVFFFARAGLAKDEALAMSLLSFVFLLAYGVLGGLVYVSTLRHRRLQCDPSPAMRPQSQ